MAIVAILIDSRPSYIRSGDGSQSLLTTPIDARLVIEHLHDDLARLTDEAVTVLAPFDLTEKYEARIRGTSAAVDLIRTFGDLGMMLEELEPSDTLLLVDARYLPVGESELPGILSKTTAWHGVVHEIVMESNPCGTREYVELDREGRVERIQRYYDRVTWWRSSATAASAMPVSVAREAPASQFRDLTSLRGRLSDRGVVSSDVGIHDGYFDLSNEEGLLAACEQRMMERGLDSPVDGFTSMGAGVLAGPECVVHRDARLRGPVVLHAGVRVEEGAALIGPAVVGAGAVVGRGAVLAECVACAGVEAPAGVRCRRRVLSGEREDIGAILAGEGRSRDASPPRGAARIIIPETAGKRPTVRRGREAYMGFKRVIESAAALLGLIVTAPFILMYAAALKATSRGPLFFYHEREGLHGQVFRCYKLRTMTADAHLQQRALYRENAVDGPQFMLQNDPRITRLGRWARKSNLDEAPQLFNVLMGQMSLIGPRPSPFRENQLCLPWREARLAVRPGITGLWQICRHERSYGDFHQWISYDILYVRHMSAWLDVKIFLATLLTLGGAWSVPLGWLIPARKLGAQERRVIGGRTSVA